MMSSPPLHLVSMFINLHCGWKLNAELQVFVLDQYIMEIFSSGIILFYSQVFPTVDSVWHSLEGYPGIRYNLN